MSNHTPSHLTNTELTEALLSLAKSGRDTTVSLVTHLAEFDARDLHLAAGFDSLFASARSRVRSPAIMYDFNTDFFTSTSFVAL